MRGLLRGSTAGLLLVFGMTTGCSQEPGLTAPEEAPAFAGRESPTFTALVRRLNLKRPRTPANPNEAYMWTYDKSGEVVAARPLTPAERWQIADRIRQQFRPLHEGRSSLPAAGEDQSPSTITALPSFAGFIDTTLTAVYENETFTEVAETSGNTTLAALTDGNNLAAAASWATFTVSGDTTTVTAMVAQAYEAGDLVEEVYYPSSELSILNEELAELGPEVQTSPESCANAASVYAAALVGYTSAGIVLRAAPNVLTAGVWLFTFGVMRYFRRPYLCECWHVCAETAPNPVFEEARFYRATPFWRQRAGLFESPNPNTPCLAGGIV